MGIHGPAASYGGSSITILVVLLLVGGVVLYLAAMPSVRRKAQEHVEEVRTHFYGPSQPAAIAAAETSPAETAAAPAVTAADVAEAIGFRYDEFTSRFGASAPQLPQSPQVPPDPAP